MNMFQRKMPGTTEESQWTIETLRQHVLAVIAANDARYSERFEASQTAMQAALASQEKAVGAALAAAKEAVIKAEMASDKRFDGVNELRGVVTDQQALFMQRLEATALFKATDEKLAGTQANNDNKLESLRLSFEKSNENLVKEIGGLRESRSETSGKSVGANVLWGYIVGAAGVGLAIIFHFVK